MKLTLTFVLSITCYLFINGQCTDFAYLSGPYDKISNTNRVNQIEQIGMISSSVDSDEFYYDEPGIPEFSNGFAKGFWIGGLDPVGNLKVAAKQYDAGRDFIPGPLVNSSDPLYDQLCAYYGRVWTITAAEIIIFQQQYNDGSLTSNNIPINILEWPAIGNPYMGEFSPQDQLAPFFDRNSDGLYNPMEGDHPIALSESPDFLPYAFNFMVYNDNTVHSESFGNVVGIEIRQTNYLLNCEFETPAKHTIFTRAEFVYKGTSDLLDCRIALWEDVDLGCYEQDMIGCDTVMQANYVYNRNGVDAATCASFNQNVPDSNAVIRSTILLNSNLESFIYNANASVGFPEQITTDPSGPVEYYQFMDAIWKDGRPLTASGSGTEMGGEETKFAFHDLPTNDNGWSMQVEDLADSDYRTVSTFYKGNLLPGQIVRLDFADYVLYDKVNKGLGIFDMLGDNINEIKATYANFGVDGFCDNGIEVCESECVRPGDTNNDETVTGFDYILNGVAIARNLTGPKRDIISDQWFPFSSSDWGESIQNLDIKHSDCNGDGNQTVIDLEVVTNNFGFTTPDSQFEDEPVGPLADLNIHLEYHPAQGDINYAEISTIVDRIVRFKLTIKNDTPGSVMPYHGISFDVKLDDKISGSFGPLNQFPSFDSAFTDYSIGGDDDFTLLNENNTFSLCWTKTDGVDIEGDSELTVFTNFLLAEGLTTPYQNGMEDINIELYNVKAINANGELIDVGFVHESPITIFNLPWDGTISTVQLNDTQSKILISPNPVLDQIQVTFEELRSGSLEFINLAGVGFGKTSFDSERDVTSDIHHLASGIYYVKVRFDNGEIGIEKLIKM